MLGSLVMTEARPLYFRISPWAISALLLLCLATVVRADQLPAINASIFAPHPAAGALQRVFAAAADDADFHPSNLTREDYATLIAQDVDCLKKFQNSHGQIIDPYAQREIQYSTPAFAVASAFLATQHSRPDLLSPASRALSCSITALVTHHAANGHSDFYIPLIMHAYRMLKDVVPADVRAQWVDQLRQIDIATAYNVEFHGMNWNIVSSCGELMRRQDGLVPADRMASQMDYLETSLAGHANKLTRFGMYRDPNAPLAYDEFARVWLEDLMSTGAYDGKMADQLRQFLKTGGLSTLLLLSPTGEWPSGGRSAFHNWNEAATILVCEINANKWQKLGRPDVAGAFKRAAHLSLAALRRWQRPTGDLWIIENRADPSERFAYETYSYFSQYNLLPMAILSIACQNADDSIAERPSPAEVGGYVFDVRDVFHKVTAAAGGYYVLIDTDADPQYNATGLQRVQKTGVAFSPLSDSTAARRVYGARSEPAMAMSPGLQWQSVGQDDWQSLADYSSDQRSTHVGSAELSVGDCSPADVAFQITFKLVGGANADDCRLAQSYVLGSKGVECQEDLLSPLKNVRVLFPALVSDGAADTRIAIGENTASIDNHGSILTWKILSAPQTIHLKLAGPRIVCHNGYMEPLVATFSPGADPASVRWWITLGTNAGS
jgi:hypothetical protein